MEVVTQEMPNKVTTGKKVPDKWIRFSSCVLSSLLLSLCFLRSNVKLFFTIHTYSLVQTMNFTSVLFLIFVLPSVILD